MGGEVYADLLFLVNFSMDFLGFYLCARLLHRPLSLWRGVLASALGVGVLLAAFPVFVIQGGLVLLAGLGNSACISAWCEGTRVFARRPRLRRAVRRCHGGAA